MLKDIAEAVEARIKSPLFGYFFLAFFAINWRPIFYVVFADSGVAERIAYFDANSSIVSLIVYPALVASLIALVFPWVSYVFLWLAAKPTNLRNSLQAVSEHALLVKKKELEELRSRMLSSAERELIDRAKRDEELENIGDEDVRNRIKEEIEELRRQREELRDSGSKSTNYTKHKELMDAAAEFRRRASGDSNTSEDSYTLMKRAQELEERAHQLIVDEDGPW